MVRTLLATPLLLASLGCSTYTAAKGFVGQDSFQTERVLLLADGAFVTCMIVHIEVTP